MRLVLDLQAQPEGLPGLDALRGMRQQFGPHLLGADHRAGAGQQSGGAWRADGGLG